MILDNLYFCSRVFPNEDSRKPLTNNAYFCCVAMASETDPLFLQLGQIYPIFKSSLRPFPNRYGEWGFVDKAGWKWRPVLFLVKEVANVSRQDNLEVFTTSKTLSRDELQRMYESGKLDSEINSLRETLRKSLDKYQKAFEEVGL